MSSAVRDKIGIDSSLDMGFEYLNFLMYGESGIGKTHFAGTAADQEDWLPMLYLDIEGGAKTIKRHVREGVIEVKRVKTLEDIIKIQHELYKDTVDPYYKSCCLDHLTELQDIDMGQIMKEAKATARDPDKVNVDVPSQREWGISRQHIRKIIRAYRDLPMHTIFIAHVLEDKEEGRASRFYPSLPGKLKGEVAGFMDVVGYYRKEKDRRVLQVAAGPRVIAKDRYSALGDLMNDPTIPSIMQKIREGDNLDAVT